MAAIDHRDVRHGALTCARPDENEVYGLSNARLPDRGQIITADVWDAYDLLGTVPEGLGPDEAQRRLELYGRNEVRRHEPYPLWRIALDQFTNPIIYVLLAAAIITAVLDHYTDTIIIMAVVVFNAIVGFFQEYKAAAAMKALREMATPEVDVRRGARVERISSEELVPGDVVLVGVGMRAAADMRIVRSVELLVDESALTGESEPILKSPDALEDPATLPADSTNVLHAGSMVTEGNGVAVVFATGAHTELGKIAEVVAEVATIDTPLQRRLHRFANVLVAAMVVLALVTVVIGLLRGMDLLTIFLVAVALAVSVIPEALPIVVTAVLSIGVWAMAKRNVLVRKLPAAETLGSVNYICSDKTGTITQNVMTAQTVLWGRYGINLRPREDETAPDIAAADGLQTPEERGVTMEHLEQLLRAAVYCSSAEFTRNEDGTRAESGSATELAILRLADGFYPGMLTAGRARDPLDAVPFSSTRKFMATLRQLEDQQERMLFAKGATEIILPRCKREWDPDANEYMQIDQQRWAKQAADLGAKGQRVLAVARREWSGHTVDADEVEDLVLLGLIGIQDPPRPEAAEAIRGCRESGISVTMITGDHPATAREIARQVGLTSGEAVSDPNDDSSVITGAEMAQISDEELLERVEDVRVYARITPHDKLRVVEALQKRNHVVAVTGDGVNDAPALRRADIGVAMGKVGTEAAREAADVVLLDDAFASIFEGVKLGRYMFETVRKVVFFLLSSGAGEVIALLGALAINWQANGETAVPFLAAQILWINLVTNGLQDVALAFEPGEDFVLKRPPMGGQARIFDRIVVTYMVVVGIIFGVGTLLVFHYVLNVDPDAGGNLALAQTAAVTMMVMFQLFHVVSCRSLVTSIFRIAPFSNPFLAISIAVSLVAQFGFVYWPPMQRLFGTVPLPAEYWIYIISMSLFAVLVMEIAKIVVRRRKWHLRGGSAGTQR